MDFTLVSGKRGLMMKIGDEVSVTTVLILKLRYFVYGYIKDWCYYPNWKTTQVLVQSNDKQRDLLYFARSLNGNLYPANFLKEI